ncbi:hypothetical protein N7517_009670 [Penicillium concentricum]|uniref:C2H2-type domain-containing protein n=1 Tax=Penicillium concentricum TaxID=293559 RepID=A0A9W9RJK9_9EURO|nr:uncharacterized protein N7517_009670 [Penicillium concentricum]KAJ5360479.1 hypothetical protein N7517_009670 [Penicillium concentricum]
MPWSSHNMDPDIEGLLDQPEGQTPGSIYPEAAPVRLGDTPTWTYPWVYPQSNDLYRNDFAVNNSNNNPQGAPIAPLGLANEITSTTPPVALPTEEPHWQELPRPGVIDNGVKTDDTPPVDRQGRVQSPAKAESLSLLKILISFSDPDTDIRCNWPGCTYRGTFTTKGSLKRHRAEKHTARRSFPCRLCGKSLSRNANRRNHLLKIHKVGA